MNFDVTFFKSGVPVEVSWPRSQVMTTADFCHGSWFWTHVTGGLNYQVGGW